MTHGALATQEEEPAQHEPERAASESQGDLQLWSDPAAAESKAQEEHRAEQQGGATDQRQGSTREALLDVPKVDEPLRRPGPLGGRRNGDV